MAGSTQPSWQARLITATEGGDDDDAPATPASATSPAAGVAWGPWHEDDIAALFGRLPVIFALLSGPCHVLETGNPAFVQAIGAQRAGTGEPIGSLMPELAEQGFLDLLDEVYRTGRPVTGCDARVLLGTGAATREAYFHFTSEPRRDQDGQVAGITVLGVETTDLKQARKLSGDQRALLEQIASDAPLGQILDGMAKVIEALSPGVLASVLLTDDDGAHLRHGAAPSLPEFYNQAIDGIATGEGVGSCGTAVHRRQPVIVADIATDPFWDDFRALAEQASLAACWSTPILAADGQLLGTFAMYYRTRGHRSRQIWPCAPCSRPPLWPSSATASSRPGPPPRSGRKQATFTTLTTRRPSSWCARATCRRCCAPPTAGWSSSSLPASSWGWAPICICTPATCTSTPATAWSWSPTASPKRGRPPGNSSANSACTTV
jgi:hypothetical protein